MRHFLSTTLLTIALMLPAGSATATGPQDELVGGLAIGTRIPEGFGLPDRAGTHRDFASLKGARGLILLFTRSLDW